MKKTKSFTVQYPITCKSNSFAHRPVCLSTECFTSQNGCRENKLGGRQPWFNELFVWRNNRWRRWWRWTIQQWRRRRRRRRKWRWRKQWGRRFSVSSSQIELNKEERSALTSMHWKNIQEHSPQREKCDIFTKVVYSERKITVSLIESVWNQRENKQYVSSWFSRTELLTLRQRRRRRRRQIDWENKSIIDWHGKRMLTKFTSNFFALLIIIIIIIIIRGRRERSSIVESKAIHPRVIQLRKYANGTTSDNDPSANEGLS